MKQNLALFTKRLVAYETAKEQSIGVDLLEWTSYTQHKKNLGAIYLADK